MWRHLVTGARLLCRHVITTEQIDEMQREFKLFAILFEELYGSRAAPPNLHMLLHVHECMRAFGPAHVFWLFPMERLNGDLGSIPTNARYFHNLYNILAII